MNEISCISPAQNTGFRVNDELSVISHLKHNNKLI